MTDKAHPEDDAPNATFLHRETSPTAASIGNPLYGPSGVQTYRVAVSNGMAMQQVDVEAATGDEAADKALAQHPGCKVAHVVPAPQPAQRAVLSAKAA